MNLLHPNQTLPHYPGAALFAALLLLAVPGVGGCTYVGYDEDFELPGSGTTTLDGFMPKTLSHLQLRGVMSRYTTRSKNGTYVLMDYDALAASPEARYTLDNYRAMLASIDPSTLATTSERLAYWINGYNASVVHGVISKYNGKASWKPTDSGKFFDDPIYTFGGQKITLNHLEQGVMRGDWAYAGLPRSGQLLAKLQAWHKSLWDGGQVDCRLHSVINCAAISCPNLLDAAPHVYEPSTLDAQMKAATTAWLDSAEKGAGKSGISSLFAWYTDDYVSQYGSVEKFITTFRTDGLKGVDTSKYLTYDWTLNIKGNR